MDHSRRNDRAGANDQNQRKKRLFVPVTLKMIADAEFGEDDVIQIEGQGIQDVSNKDLMDDEIMINSNFCR
jgi:hypothetical protein